MRVIVIGAGASGLAAACTAAENGAKVTLLEKHRRPGRKILASGNGRCNIMNTGNVYIHGEDLAKHVLQRVSRSELIGFWEKIGLQVLSEPEEDGRLYPSIMQSEAVLHCLLNRLRELNVELRTELPAESIERDKNGYLIRSKLGQLRGDSVIIAAGSPAGGNLGSNAYNLLKQLQHPVTPIIPALCPIQCDGLDFRMLKGLRFPAVLTLHRNGRPIEQSRGEVLLTDNGVSGICAMQLSGTAAQFPFDGKTVLCLDLSPLLDLSPRTHEHLFKPPFFTPPTDKTETLLNSRRAYLQRDRLLYGLIPEQLIPCLDDRKIGIKELATRLMNVPLTVKGVVSERSQVIRGGADLSAFRPDTLESKLYKGLYCAGEILDVDGDCGGFNLMFAFASGILTGRQASKGGAHEL